MSATPSTLDQALVTCPTCNADLTWDASHGYHVATCVCGWTWGGPAPATARCLLSAALARYPALRDHTLAAVEGALLKAEDKRYQRAEAERSRAWAREAAKTRPCLVPGCVDQPSPAPGWPCIPHAREGRRQGIGPGRGENRAWTVLEIEQLVAAINRANTQETT
jgi:hypothetical protein